MSIFALRERAAKAVDMYEMARFALSGAQHNPYLRVGPSASKSNWSNDGLGSWCGMVAVKIWLRRIAVLWIHVLWLISIQFLKGAVTSDQIAWHTK